MEKAGDNVDTNLNLDVIKDSEFSSFTEVIPLNEEIENLPRKDFSSVSISEISFPNVVYMVVDKRIELEIKKLKDYPDWHFLSENELERKTIEIYIDLKVAKRSCNKEQKVIKVPNTKVFEIAAPILISRGISRIISDDKLIALWNSIYFLLKRKILPAKEPLIKLIPKIKLTGKLIELWFNIWILLLLELFCIPISNIKIKLRLNVKVNNIFFNFLLKSKSTFRF